MSSIPPKPWEINRATTPPCCPPGSSTNNNLIGGNLHSAGGGGMPSTPPVPPRPASQQVGQEKWKLIFDFQANVKLFGL